MKTISSLRREASSGGLAFELIKWFDKTGSDIPGRIRGIRRVSKVNTVGIYLLGENGVESELST